MHTDSCSMSENKSVLPHIDRPSSFRHIFDGVFSCFAVSRRPSDEPVLPTKTKRSRDSHSPHASHDHQASISINPDGDLCIEDLNAALNQPFHTTSARKFDSGKADKKNATTAPSTPSSSVAETHSKAAPGAMPKPTLPALSSPTLPKHQRIPSIELSLSPNVDRNRSPTPPLIADPPNNSSLDVGTSENAESSSVEGSSNESPTNTRRYDTSLMLNVSHNRSHSNASTLTHASSISNPSTPSGFLRHRRTSSAQNHVFSYKETLNATSKDLDDGSRRLNQYLIGEEIGKGSFGSVLRAKDVESDIEYAVKEISKHRLRKKIQSESLRANRLRGRGRNRGVCGGLSPQPSHSDFEDDRDPLHYIRGEIAIMKKLDHPNIVRLVEALYVEDGDSLFMVIELCHGPPIMSISCGQRAEPFSEIAARNYYRQIILGVEYLHYNDIVHRDIKPDNILLAQDLDVCKIVDFGVSEMFEKHGEDKHLKLVGTPAFMSPELILGNMNEDHAKASDMWAMGVLLYCFVCGCLPFENSGILDLHNSIVNDSPSIPDHLSSDLKDLLNLLLEKDPDRRIGIQEIREHSWVTNEGHDPLPTTEDNVSSIVLTKHDLDDAFQSIQNIVLAKRAASTLRRKVAERRRQASISASASTSNSNLAASVNGDLENDPMYSEVLHYSPEQSLSSQMGTEAISDIADSSVSSLPILATSLTASVDESIGEALPVK